MSLMHTMSHYPLRTQNSNCALKKILGHTINLITQDTPLNPLSTYGDETHKWSHLFSAQRWQSIPNLLLSTLSSLPRLKSLPTSGLPFQALKLRTL